MYIDYYISTGKYLNRPIYKKLEFFDDLFQHFGDQYKIIHFSSLSKDRILA